MLSLIYSYLIYQGVKSTYYENPEICTNVFNTICKYVIGIQIGIPVTEKGLWEDNDTCINGFVLIEPKKDEIKSILED